MITRPRLTAAALAATVLLAGCASDPGAEAPLTVTDPWVKTAESGMTAAFGVVENPSGEDVTIVAATSVAAPVVELHEVVDGAMQELGAGMTVPAGGTLTLEPGGYHLMLLELPGAIVAGDEVAFTLELSDGSTVDFTATAKDFDGGEESYHEADMTEDHDS